MRTLAGATFAVVVFVAGCSSSSSTPMCSGSTSTLTVTVVDTDGDNICDATVKASGPMQVTFARTGNTTSCVYIGTAEGGNYNVTATATGFEDGTTPITIQSGCSIPIEIDLTVAPP